MSGTESGGLKRSFVVDPSIMTVINIHTYGVTSQMFLRTPTKTFFFLWFGKLGHIPPVLPNTFSFNR